MSIETVELPAIYLDAIIEDLATSLIGAQPTLINEDPEPGETRVVKSTHVGFDIATCDASGTIDLAATEIYIDGELAFQAGTFQSGFNGPSSAYSNPQADVLRILIDPTVDFVSEATVTVRVVSKAVGDPTLLDTTYTFTIADTTAPRILKVEAIDLNRLRVTFNESVKQDDVNSNSALDPANYTLDRLGDYVTPLVSASVVSVDETSTGALDTVDLITDIPLTRKGYYRLTAANLEDVNGNPIAAPYNAVYFYGWQPPVPEGRDFDLYRKLPAMNRSEDDTLDLFRFIACLQEVADLLLYDIDRFIDILDPDTAPEDFVDAMLADLGNPFAFDLSLTDKRRLAQVLVDMYRLKGTAVGIENVIRFFLGIEVVVEAFNASQNTWVMGDSELGVGSILGTDDVALVYSFIVTVMQTLTDDARKQIRSIVEYMKPAHTHFVRLVEPEVPLVLDHLELGYSELGENWELH